MHLNNARFRSRQKRFVFRIAIQEGNDPQAVNKISLEIFSPEEIRNVSW